MMPKKLNKKVLKNLDIKDEISSVPGNQQQENNDKRIKSEEQMKKWIKNFTEQIEKIDQFYC